MTTNNILFYSNHYKRSLFFEDTIKRIISRGYRFIILNTGPQGEFRNCEISSPRVSILNTSSTSYDGGMATFKSNKLLDIDSNVKYIIHLDNDCFLSDTNELEEYIDEFITGDYDYACHLVSQPVADKFKSDTHICHVTNPTVTYPDDSGVPSVYPHYENAYQIIRKSMWDRLSVDDVSHHRKFIAALSKQGAKMGAHRASYLWDYTNWGKEWFHLGHIMEKYLSLEGSSIEALTKYNKDSDFDRVRAGYFAAQERYYGSGIYSDRMHSRLQIYYGHFGGKDVVLEAWDRICRGTCMENWRVVE